jgi:hypothetical protein
MAMTRSRMLALALVTAVSCVAPPPSVEAHGRPEHGGAFDEVEEYTFELIANRNPKDDVSFRLYIKDPALKPVTTGDVTLQVNLGPDKYVPIKLKPTDRDAFEGATTLTDHGRRKITVLFARPGHRVLRSRLSVKLS